MEGRGPRLEEWGFGRWDSWSQEFGEHTSGLWPRFLGLPTGRGGGTSSVGVLASLLTGGLYRRPPEPES